MSKSTNIQVSSTNSVDVSVVRATDPKSVAITNGSNVNVSINSEAGNKVLATQKSPSLSLSITDSDDLGVQTKEKMSVTVINPNEYIYQEGSEPANWGGINGTVTDQTDLVNYITSVLPDVPYETAQDIVDALNSFGNDGFSLSTVPLLKRSVEIGNPDVEEIGSYTLPDGDVWSETGVGPSKFGYFLLTDSEGNLYWKNFPLDFLTGGTEEAAVDGGTF